MNRFKDFYNKRDFDYNRGYIDPCDFHTYNMYFLLKLFRVLENKTASWTLLWMIFNSVHGFIGLGMGLMSTYHGVDIKDLTFIAEAMMYTIVFTHHLLIIISSKTDTKEFNNFLQAMRRSFDYACTTGDKYRKRFFEEQVKTWKASIILLFFLMSCCIGIVMFSFIALLFYLATHKPEDDAKRPLVFPVWSPYFDVGDSPYYEILFVVFNFVPISAASAFTLSMVVQLIWAREISTKADLVKWQIEDVLDGIPLTNDKEQNFRNLSVLKSRMRVLVSQHIDMYMLLDDFCGVYKKFMTFLIELYALEICFTAYSVAEKMNEGEFRYVPTTLCIAVFVVTLVQSYLCTMLSSKVNEVADWCWCVPFWEAGPELRAYIIMIMNRALQPLPFRVAGFHEMGLPTFSQKTTTAYSMFNMLRQTNK